MADNLNFSNKPELGVMWEDMKEWVSARTYSKEEIDGMGYIDKSAIEGKADKVTTYDMKEVNALVNAIPIGGGGTTIVYETGDGGDMEALTYSEIYSLLK